MFKKIEIWILYLLMLFSILFAVFFGVLVRQELVGSIKLGWLSKTALTLAEIPQNLRKIAQGLNNDLILEDRFPFLDSFDGEPNTQESYLLLSRYDGDLKEGVVELVDLTNFKVLHTWNPDIDAFNSLVEKVDEFKFLDRDANNSRSRLIHPLLINDGELVFKDSGPLRKIDECSNLIFQNQDDMFHHSIESDIDGNIWVPSYIYPQTLPITAVGRNTKDENGYLENAITKLSPDGEIIYKKSVSEIFIENNLEYLLYSVGDAYFTIDPIHMNDIQPVEFDGAYWKEGDIFLSMRHQSMVVLYRPSTNKIIWIGTGPFFHQHDVDIIDAHRISIFNNNSKQFINGDSVDGNNEVIIYDFKKNEYSSYLSNSMMQNEVRTITEGRSQILDNGDLIVEESNYARVLYFNADGSLRWTYLNRAKSEDIFYLGWVRILHTKREIDMVKNFLSNKGFCND